MPGLASAVYASTGLARSIPSGAETSAFRHDWKLPMHVLQVLMSLKESISEYMREERGENVIEGDEAHRLTQCTPWRRNHYPCKHRTSQGLPSTPQLPTWRNQKWQSI